MLISVDERDPRPIYVQIAGQVKEQIRSGRIEPGDELPSVRELAETLGVNLHTVHKAYQKLREQGVLNMRLGRAARVADLRQVPAGQKEIEEIILPRLQELMTEAFHLGLSIREFRALVEDALEEWEKETDKR